MKWHKNVRRKITTLFGIRVPNEHNRIKVQNDDNVSNYMLDNVKVSNSKTFQNKSHKDISEANSASNSPMTEASSNIKTGSYNVKLPKKKNRYKPKDTKKDDYPDRLNPFQSNNNYDTKNTGEYPIEFNPFEFEDNDDAAAVYHGLNDECENNPNSEKSCEIISITFHKNTTDKSYDTSQENSLSNSPVMKTFSNIKTESCSVSFLNNQDLSALKEIKEDKYSDILNPFCAECNKNDTEFPIELNPFQEDVGDNDATLVHNNLKNEFNNESISENSGDSISIMLREEIKITNYDNSQANSSSKAYAIERSVNIETKSCNLQILDNQNTSKGKEISKDGPPGAFNPSNSVYNKKNSDEYPTEINLFESNKNAIYVQNLSTTCLTENKIKEVRNPGLKSFNDEKRHQVKQIRQKRRAPNLPIVQQINDTDILSYPVASSSMQFHYQTAKEEQIQKSKIKYSDNSANRFFQESMKVMHIQKHSSESEVFSKIYGCTMSLSSSSLRYSTSDPVLTTCKKELNSLKPKSSLSETSQLQHMLKKTNKKAPPPPSSKASSQGKQRKVKRQAPPPPTQQEIAIPIGRRAHPLPISKASSQRKQIKIKRQVPPPSVQQETAIPIRRRAPPPPISKASQIPKRTRMLQLGNFLKKIFKH